MRVLKPVAVVGAAVVTLLATLVAPVGPATAADNGSWAAVPIRQDGQQFRPRQYFFFDAAPGDVLRDTTTITNATTEPLTLDLYPADAFNVVSGGGFGLKKKDEEQTDVGSWVDIGRVQVVVPKAKKNKEGELVPGSVNVPFTMTVPRSAGPGDHAGGFVTQELSTSPSVSDGVNVAVRRALTVRIYVRVNGPLNPQLLVTDMRYTDLKPATLPLIGNEGRATIEYTYVNSGNARITPTQEITFKGLFGRTVHTLDPVAVPEILPGEEIRISQSVEGMPSLDRVTAEVTLRGDVNSDPDLVAVGDTVRWSVSAWFLLVLLVIAALIGYRAYRRFRRSRTAVEPAEGDEQQHESVQV